MPAILRAALVLLRPAIAVAVAPPTATACRILVVEKGSGWPVPLVELRTTHHVRLVSDNGGVIACDLPELLGRETWFTVHADGYAVPKDGFGFRGLRLTPKAGSTLKVEVKRTSIAKRLGRLTGAGLFAESQKLGDAKEWKESGLVGCDSVLTTPYKGRLFWAWGDTTLANYPLGVFDASSATTRLKPLKEFAPPLKMDYQYFRDDRGKPRGVAKLAGKGPTWLTGYTSVRDKDGGERLVASYMKIRPPLDIYEWGLCVWNDRKESFEPLRVVWTKSDKTPKPPPMPEGHPVTWKDDRGKEWLLFGNPLPRLRCPATFEGWQDSSTWEVLKPQETLKDADGKAVKPHSGSIAYNAYRKRWVSVFMEFFGKPSPFGELWYAEADTPTGPWGPAVKVLSHENYTFYNPRLHPDLTPAGSPVLLFEGTYTVQFTAKPPPPTPRYDYNQILYRLDLDDAALGAARKR